MTTDSYLFDCVLVADAATRIVNEVRGINRVV
jgi:GMP synthase PP-ATPase subunit